MLNNLKWNRRQFLLGTAASAAVLAAPAIAFPRPSAWEQIEKNVMQFKDDHMFFPLRFDVFYEMNKRLVLEHPDLFHPDYVAASPTGIYVHNDERRCFIICHRYFKISISLEFIQDLRCCGVDPEAEIMDMMIPELAAEIYRTQQLIRNLTHPNRVETSQMVSYIPLIPVRDVDSNTFQPKISFKTRYGWAHSNSKILTMEEERAMTMRKERALYNDPVTRRIYFGST